MSDVLLRPLKIIKRQADKSKPLLKDQSGMDTENSPNNKTVDVPTTEATFTTESGNMVIPDQTHNL